MDADYLNRFISHINNFFKNLQKCGMIVKYSGISIRFLGDLSDASRYPNSKFISALAKDYINGCNTFLSGLNRLLGNELSDDFIQQCLLQPLRNATEGIPTSSDPRLSPEHLPSSNSITEQAAISGAIDLLFPSTLDTSNLDKRRKKRKKTRKLHACPVGGCTHKFLSIKALDHHKAAHEVSSAMLPNPPPHSPTTAQMAPETVPHRCSFCAVNFDNESHFISHMKKHGSAEDVLPLKSMSMFACILCHEFYIRHEDFVAHDCSDTRKKGKLKDKSTDSLMNGARFLATTRELIQNIGVFSCARCQAPFRKRWRAENHTTLCRRSCACEICGGTFSRYQDLIAHKKTIHPGSPLFHCRECQKSYSTSSGLLKHEERHHPADVNRVRIECGKCRLTFSKKICLTRHLRSEHGENSNAHLCHVCGLSYKDVFKLKEHLSVNHLASSVPAKTFYCTTCLVKFTRKDRYENHIRIHTGERPFACSRCPSRFRTKTKLTLHDNARHDPIKRFKCDFCEMLFPWTSSRNMHMRRMHPAEVAKGKAELALPLPPKSPELHTENAPLPELSVSPLTSSSKPPNVVSESNRIPASTSADPESSITVSVESAYENATYILDAGCQILLPAEAIPSSLLLSSQDPSVPVLYNYSPYGIIGGEALALAYPAQVFQPAVVADGAAQTGSMILLSSGI